ncbi:MAG: hypothetical protein QM820_52845 [Minicystis sp.]
MTFTELAHHVGHRLGGVREGSGLVGLAISRQIDGDDAVALLGEDVELVAPELEVRSEPVDEDQGLLAARVQLDITHFERLRQLVGLGRLGERHALLRPGLAGGAAVREVLERERRLAREGRRTAEGERAEGGGGGEYGSHGASRTHTR